MSRKYRQQGYQDSDRDASRSAEHRPPARKLSPEERLHRKGLRHATAREANEVIRCHHCGRNFHNFGTIAADSECPHCSAPLHCCRTCLSFDTRARWECRAEITEAVSNKSKANSCSEYAPRIVLDTTGRRSETPRGGNGNGNGRSGGGPRAEFENLFKR